LVDDVERGIALFRALPYRQATDPEAGEPERGGLLCALGPELGGGTSLDDPEESLVGPLVHGEPPLGPPEGASHLALHDLPRRRQADTDVEDHGDVGADVLLDPDRVLRSEMDPRPVVDGPERGAPLLDLRVEREDLETAGVGEDAALPRHEGVDAAHLLHEVLAGAEHE